MGLKIGDGEGYRRIVAHPQRQVRTSAASRGVTDHKQGLGVTNLPCRGQLDRFAADDSPIQPDKCPVCAIQGELATDQSLSRIDVLRQEKLVRALSASIIRNPNTKRIPGRGSAWLFDHSGRQSRLCRREDGRTPSKSSQWAG